MIKVLIRLHGCEGWSAPVLFAKRKVFLRRGPFYLDLPSILSLLLTRLVTSIIHKQNVRFYLYDIKMSLKLHFSTNMLILCQYIHDVFMGVIE